MYLSVKNEQKCDNKIPIFKTFLHFLNISDSSTVRAARGPSTRSLPMDVLDISTSTHKQQVAPGDVSISTTYTHFRVRWDEKETTTRGSFPRWEASRPSAGRAYLSFRLAMNSSMDTLSRRTKSAFPNSGLSCSAMTRPPRALHLRNGTVRYGTVRLPACCDVGSSVLTDGRFRGLVKL